jgi:phosphohistidine phosphatase
MVTLVLLRHAKTNQESNTGMDIDRELLPKGIKQTTTLRDYIQTNEFKFEEIHVSNAKRTIQTAEKVLPKNYFSSCIISSSLYLSNRIELLCYLSEIRSKHVLIIGHNDGLSDLCSYLIDDYYHLKTGHLVEIKFEIDSFKFLSLGLGYLHRSFRPEV